MPKLYHKRHKNEFSSIIKTMKKILAVSGGIDSVVMLHLLKDEHPIVAHFDHGIRSNSHEDAEFVERLAKEYGLVFEVKHAKLGKNCSEATARAARYDFLQEVAKKYDGIVCVAHHADDVVESVAINLIRGTGWRGLAPMNSANIERPLLEWRKSDVYRYATEHNLLFRQDQTNTEGDYLRNRVREKLRDLPEENKQQLLELYKKQSALLEEYAGIMRVVFSNNDSHCAKNIVVDSPNECATEIVRFFLAEQQISLTRPQLEKCVDAIKNFAPGKRLSLDRKHFLEVGKYSFHVI